MPVCSVAVLQCVGSAGRNILHDKHRSGRLASERFAYSRAMSNQTSTQNPAKAQQSVRALQHPRCLKTSITNQFCKLPNNA